MLPTVKVASGLKSINAWTVTMAISLTIRSVSLNAHQTDIKINHSIVTGATNPADPAGGLLFFNAYSATMTVMFIEENAMTLVLLPLT